MEIVAEKEKQENSVEQKNVSKKTNFGFSIFGFSIWRLLTYFVLYSILGFIIETLFGLCTKGVIESRKSFLYGPFCAIYGLGAVVMLIFLQYFKKNNGTLFLGGFLIGSIVEYLVSWIGEMLLHVKWWDYSAVPFNIQGRVCVFFSLFWGILAIFLVKTVHPRVDKFIEKHISTKYLKVFSIILILFMFVDCLITGFALRMFNTRLVLNYDLELQNVENYIEDYKKLYSIPEVKEFADKHFSDEKMLKTFPNLKVTGKDGQIIYVSDILKDIPPYYIRVFTPTVRGKPIIEPETYEEK